MNISYMSRLRRVYFQTPSLRIKYLTRYLRREIKYLPSMLQVNIGHSQSFDI